MSVEIDVQDYLSGVAGVTALVGQRIFQVVVPQNQQVFPVVRIDLVNDIERYHLRGLAGILEGLVQIDAYAEERSGVDAYQQAVNVAAAVDEALVGEPWTAGSPLRELIAFRESRRVLREEVGTRRFIRMMQDFTIWSRERVH